MTHFSSSSLRVSRTEKVGRAGFLQPVLGRRPGLLSLVFLLGWIPLWSKQVYVTNTNVTDTSPSVSVINASSDTVVNNVPLGGETFGVAITPNGKFAYVTVGTPSSIAVINTGTKTVSTPCRWEWVLIQLSWRSRPMDNSFMYQVHMGTLFR
jgi:hypothetical protein